MLTPHLVSRDVGGALYGVCSSLPERETALWRQDEERAGRAVTEHATAADVRALVRAEGTAYTRWERARREASAAAALPVQPSLL